MRHLFGRNRADWVMETGEQILDDDEVVGYVPVMLPGQAVTLWDARTGGNQVTDLTEPETGDSLSGLSADSDGNLPLFRGPDGVRQVWASASSDGTATRYSMGAIDLGDEIGDLDTRVSTLESGGVGSQVPEVLRFTAELVTPEHVTDPPSPYRAYNVTGNSQTVTETHVSATVAPASGPLEFDVRIDGTSVFAAAGDRPTVPAGSNTSGIVTPTGATSLASGAYLTVIPTAGDADAEAVTVSVRVV